MSENPLEFGMVCVVAKLTLCYVFQRVLFFLSCTKIPHTKKLPAGSFGYGKKESDIDAVVLRQRAEAALEALTDGLEFPLAVVAVDFAEDHRGFN